MRIATVRDLRNHYLKILDWVGAGEEILITRRGKSVARLVPEKPLARRAVDWRKSPAVLRDRSKVIPLSSEESTRLRHEAAGQW